MTRIPTPEEAGEYILSLFVEAGKGNGEVASLTELGIHNFSSGPSTEDNSEGVIYAIERGWLEQVPPHFLRLTSEGHAVAYQARED